MSYAPHTNTDVKHQRANPYAKATLPLLLGSFRHKDTEAFFEYSERLAPNCDWAPDLPHQLFMSDGSVRAANIKQTVAYVAIDEDAEGRPVLERWPLKQHRHYPTDWVQA
jgi:hypothetical protein